MPAYVAKSERAEYCLRFPRFAFLIMRRIVLVSLSPAGCAFLTLSALRGVPNLITIPETVGSQVFFSLASEFSIIWLIVSIAIIVIEDFVPLGKSILRHL